MSDVWIYTVGSRLTGLGHVKRCLTLAAELKKRGVGVVFATEHETPGVSIIREAGHVVREYHPLDFSWAKMGGTYRNLIVDVMGDPSERLIDAARPAFDKIIVLSAAGYAPQGV
jgi:hypothetical protein